MTSISVSRDVALQAAVGQAVLAPSVHNTQPWRFLLRRAALDITADRSRQLAVLDPTGRQLHLSLGCALLNARVSLAASGCPHSVVRLPDPEDADVIARVELDTGYAVDPALAALDRFITRRQTNRRRFATDPVPEELVDRLVRVAGIEGAHLHPVVDPDDRQELARLSQRADVQQLTDAAYRAELRVWTGDDPRRLDGVRAAVVPHVDGSAGDEVPIRDFDTHGVGRLPAETHSSAHQCLLILGTELDNPQAWVRAGEALERVWLEITKAGFVASVFTQVVEIAVLRAQLRADLRLQVNPHIVLRVGRAPLTAASNRRHLADVVVDQRQPG